MITHPADVPTSSWYETPRWSTSIIAANRNGAGNSHPMSVASLFGRTVLAWGMSTIAVDPCRE
jgi:hypothetical protein